ncbi:putative secreted protein (Por secretion system target) [Dyadobacter jiangsuensis]|uniref:Putative secreted protein (Por secretion system target) n=2 Tax=Dyadobacter jiangsuensis TaxID=1591085 RepID=A0A2P8GIM9_9BACT|nr:putative secreted protein (Por secretion system target) [Dyadobacter jiangsuensis]
MTKKERSVNHLWTIENYFMKRNVQVAAIALASAMLACFGARAQTPGGVSPAAWYRADAPGSVFSDAGSTAASNNATVQQWNEARGTGSNLIQATASARPVFSNSSALANFNPTVTFDGSNDFLQFTAGTGVNLIDRANGSIYAAGYVNTLKQSGFAGFHASMDYPGLHIFGSNNKLLFFTGGPGYQGLSASAYTAGMFFSAGSGWQNGAGTNASYAAATVSLNGTRTDYNGSQLYNANLSTGARDFRIGADNNYGAFSGQLNEVMVFEDKLTADQMDRVETYLAIKYGTTYASGTRDYKNSAGNVVWSASANTGSQSNIAGIGRDDNGALHQKQSWSTSNGRQVLIGTGTLAGSNADNATGLNNGQFLVWGDNGLAKTPNVAIAGIGGISHRFAAIWKVQNTGSVGTVRVAWPKSLLGMKLIQSSDATIDASDVSTDMSANETVINGVTFNYADVTLSDGQYFTFGAKVPAPGGVVNGILMWHKADDGVTTAGAKNIWQDVSGNGRDVSQNNNATYQPSLVTNASFTANSKNYAFNFNPFYYFDGSNDFFYRQNDAYFPSTTSPGSTYGVMFNSAAGGYNTAYGWGDDDPNLVRANNNYQFWRDNGLPLQADVSLNTTNAHIGGMAWKGAANGLYLNVDGRTFSTTSYNIGNIATGNPPTFQIGSEGYNTAAYGWEQYQGAISEVFAYSTDHQNSGGDEKQRINSYLAIKYGITLKNDAGTGVPNYLSSASTVVWNATNNAAYSKNIAGLAKDDASALNQKQSRSNVNGQQVLIGTTGLSGTNAGNGTSLSDGQFLIWGDNGGAKSLSVGITGIVDLNLRFGSIWKVQNTGNVGTVRVTWPAGIPGLHLLQSSDAVFDASDTRTDMTGNTQTINGVAYNYTDVTLADGQYFTFAGYVVGPGGVASAAWYRADGAGQQYSDAGTTPAADNEALQQWNEFKGTGFDLAQASSGARPVFSNATTLANFNPTVTFDGSNDLMQFTAGTGVNVIDRANGSLYAAGFVKTIQNSGFLGFHDSMDYPGLHMFNNTGAERRLLFFTGGPGYQGLATDAITSRSYFTAGSGWQNGAGATAAYAGATVSFNGVRTDYTGNQLQNAVINDASRSLRIGADNNYGSFNGQLNEVVVFENKLTEAEMDRVETYMAIKYGNTFAKGLRDYKNSTSGTVWTAATNTGYHNNIAGIARDDEGSLYQRQSWSTNLGRQVLVSTTGLANTNAANNGALANGQFLVWGDNALARTPSVSISGISGVNYRFAAIWKAQNTNNVGVVRVAWPKGLGNLKLIQSSDATIDASDVITDMGASQQVNGVEYAYADVTLADGQYFTFAAFVQGPGGVTNNLSLWYRADIYAEATGEGSDVNSWTDFTSGTVAAQLGDVDLPKYKAGDATYFNFNPGVNFTAANQTLGNITVPTVSAQQYDIFTLTKEGLAPGGNGRVFSALVKDTDLSGSINYWDGIGILADNRIERMNTAYNFRYLANPGNINWSSNSPSIMYNTFTNTTVAKGLNGAANGTTATHTAIGTLTGGHAIGTTQFSSNGSDNAGFTGHIGELVVYGGGNITATERNKVDSYLAIKYGVTLNNSNNYTTSGGTVVWDATANSGYYTNVAGIGKDFISALEQKQSRSQHANTNNQVIIGLGGIAATNAANTGALSDGQFLVWGDNGNTQAMTNTAGTYTAFAYEGSINNARRMNRIWKVQNTNVGGETLIRFPQASVGTTTLSNDACAGYVIIFASDAAFSTNVTAIPVTVNGSDYEATHSFPNGASYFTFGKVTPITTGTVYLPTVTEETTQYVDNCATGEWTYYRNTADASQKLFATSNVSATVLNNLTVKITPEGVTYSDAAKTTSLMPRITTVTDASGTPLAGAKVRVYYSASELAATQLPGAQVNGWFKYEGTAEDVISNVYASGLLDVTKAVALTPNASGVEDGVNYVEFHNISSFSSFVYLSTTNESALPVTLTYFKAAKEGGIANLAWGTAEEVNNKGFEIQRSADARSWNTIGFVENQTEGGNSKGALTYDFKDGSPMAGTNYYRLKQIDFDGTYMYSSAVALQFDGGKGTLSVYPNPVTNGSLSLNLPQAGSYKLSIFNVGGIQVLNAVQSGNTVDIRSLRSGVYVLRVVYENGQMHSKTFVVK